MILEVGEPGWVLPGYCQIFEKSIKITKPWGEGRTARDALPVPPMSPVFLMLIHRLFLLSLFIV